MVGAIAAVGGWMVLRITAKGIRLTPDSFGYLGIAHSLANGKGYAQGFDGPGFPAETKFPPLYPTALSVSHLIHANPLAYAAWMNAVLFAVLVVLVAAAVYDLSRSPIAAGFAGALTCTTASLLDIYRQAWSEPTFFVFEASALWMLARYAARRRRRDLYLAALPTGLAMLTRYAGVSLFVLGLTVVLTGGRRPLRVTLSDTARFLVAAGTPFCLWILRNKVVANSTTGRVVAHHAVGHSRWHRASITIGEWLTPLHVPHTIGLWWLLAPLAGCVVALITPARLRAALGGSTGCGIAVAGGYIPVYAVFLLASVSSAAAGVHFNDRILSPALVAAIMAIPLIGRALSVAVRWRWVAFAAWGLAAILVTANSARLTRAEVRGVTAEPAPFQVAWQSSPLIARIRELPGGTVIYSNVAGALLATTNRVVYQLPDPMLPRRTGPNPEYAAEMRELRRHLRQTGGVVAEFTGNLSHGLTRPGYWARPDGVRRSLRLLVMAQVGGDALLVAKRVTGT